MTWPMVKLRKLVLANYGKALKKENRNESGTIDVFGSAGDVGFHNETLIQGQTIVVGRKGSVGKTIWAPKGGWVIDTAYYLIIKDKVELDWRYLFYALKDSKLDRKTITTSIPGLNREDFYDTEIPLPPLDEQKRIAAILDKADAIRQKRKQANQLTDDFLRSVFLDMFGDPVTNPKGWKIQKWKSVLRIVNGKNQKKVEMIGGKYPICGSGGVMSWANDWLVEENSIIIGRKGSINSPILMKQKFWNVDTAFGLEPQKELLSYNYLFWFCKFFNFEALNKTVTIPSLTKLDLSEIEIAVPPLEVQRFFDQIVRSIDCLRDKFPTHDTINLFDSLSQKAFSGQL